MNKTVAIFFICFYLGSLFFCIFLRIESWPFSDYRVYARSIHPESVKAHIPYFKLSDGSYFDPRMTEFDPYMDIMYFSHIFLLSDSPDKDWYVNRMLKSRSLKRAVRKMRKNNINPVKFVVMRVTFKEETKHKWMPVYTPWEEYDIP